MFITLNSTHFTEHFTKCYNFNLFLFKLNDFMLKYENVNNNTFMANILSIRHLSCVVILLHYNRFWIWQSWPKVWKITMFVRINIVNIKRNIFIAYFYLQWLLSRFLRTTPRTILSLCGQPWPGTWATSLPVSLTGTRTTLTSPAGIPLALYFSLKLDFKLIC